MLLIKSKLRTYSTRADRRVLFSYPPSEAKVGSLAEERGEMRGHEITTSAGSRRWQCRCSQDAEAPLGPHPNDPDGQNE